MANVVHYQNVRRHIDGEVPLSPETARLEASLAVSLATREVGDEVRWLKSALTLAVDEMTQPRFVLLHRQDDGGKFSVPVSRVTGVGESDAGAIVFLGDDVPEDVTETVEQVNSKLNGRSI